jgi:benzoyl-CoA reductase/2-hydroxyglutaryl-CoA dehydratase subunit BcrC/BadD/HgdB
MADDQNYRTMWKDMGLNLEKHDALLSVLGQLYSELFMTQKNRPMGMQYFDFVMSEVHGLRIKELLDARETGRKVIGAFCVFVPEEFVLALDGILVGLCAGADFGTDEAERYLPRNTCALIKSFFGFTLEQVCPYIKACDMIVGENTCDGKKKAYEIYKDLFDNLYVMDLPQMKNATGKGLLKAEYRKFIVQLEKLTGKKMDLAALKKGIELVNGKRRALQRLAKLRAHSPVPISGLDSLLTNQVYFYDDPVRFTDSLEKICDELEARVAVKEGVAPVDVPRILISGCPMAVPNWKVPAIIESTGAVIVGEESCVGERGTQVLTGATGDTLEQLIDHVVDRYWEIDCAIFTPNSSRLDHVRKMVIDYRADGVIHYALQFCSPYQIESNHVEKSLENNGIPVLRIDTDYSQEDTEQIRTRVEAFIERIRG